MLSPKVVLVCKPRRGGVLCEVRVDETRVGLRSNCGVFPRSQCSPRLRLVSWPRLTLGSYVGRDRVLHIGSTSQPLSSPRFARQIRRSCPCWTPSLGLLPPPGRPGVPAFARPRPGSPWMWKHVPRLQVCMVEGPLHGSRTSPNHALEIPPRVST